MKGGFLMKKLLAMALVLVLVLCSGVTAACAQTAGLNKFVGYWEVQNIALGGYTVGANYLGFEMHASIHEDGVCIFLLDNEMVAGYINGAAGNYYLDDGYDIIPLSFDSQGRIHVDLTNGGSTKLDVRMRKATPERLTSSQNAYVGSWKLTSAEILGIEVDAEDVGEVAMTVYEDGFATLVANENILPFRLGMYAGSPCFLDNEGEIVTLTMDANGVMSFSVSYEGSQMTFNMERSLY